MAILATRRKIEKMLEKARFYATGPLTERYIRVSHPIEYYGDIKITVYCSGLLSGNRHAYVPGYLFPHDP